ncbi:hypothetical protein [Parasedimentitalea huanghaiensis]|uniref:Uncharacterized protein n=1 Tax=Parasedimentitalea huanghaiensis TaxID=2682100 RepID=A0A6L6WCC6_9RHOB|nr:hypothetical protein [Zongyanglinia huanghaiensis]MVO14185.1 hypothetical protein [Zongyanglinia huanghaiensis]
MKTPFLAALKDTRQICPERGLPLRYSLFIGVNPAFSAILWALLFTAIIIQQHGTEFLAILDIESCRNSFLSSRTPLRDIDRLPFQVFKSCQFDPVCVGECCIFAETASGQIETQTLLSSLSVPR